MMASNNEEQPEFESTDQCEEKKIPVLTVLKNDAIVKNIFLLGRPPLVSSPDDGGRQEQRQDLEETLTVGRHPDCNIVLKHPSISRFHISIRYKPSSHKLSVTDLSSAHGTWVSGTKIEPGTQVDLNEGNTMRLGGSSRIYRLHWVPLSQAYDLENPYVPPLDVNMSVEEHEEEADQEENHLHGSESSETLNVCVSDEGVNSCVEKASPSAIPVVGYMGSPSSDETLERDGTSKNNTEQRGNSSQGTELSVEDIVETNRNRLKEEMDIEEESNTTEQMRNPSQEIEPFVEDIVESNMNGVKEEMDFKESVDVLWEIHKGENITCPTLNIRNSSFSMEGIGEKYSLEKGWKEGISPLHGCRQALATKSEHTLEFLSDVNSEVSVGHSIPICEDSRELEANKCGRLSCLIAMADSENAVFPDKNIVTEMKSKETDKDSNTPQVEEKTPLTESQKYNLNNNQCDMLSLIAMTDSKNSFLPNGNILASHDSNLDSKLSGSLASALYAMGSEHLLLPIENIGAGHECNLNGKLCGSGASSLYAMGSEDSVFPNENILAGHKCKLNGNLCGCVVSSSSLYAMASEDLTLPHENILAEIKNKETDKNSSTRQQANENTPARAGHKCKNAHRSRKDTVNREEEIYFTPDKENITPATVQPRYTGKKNATGGESKSWSMVVDTTCLLDSKSIKALQMLQGLKGTQLIIPRVVINELNSMKQRSSLLRNLDVGRGSLSTRTTRALQWIEQCMMNTSWWIHVQRLEEGGTLTRAPDSPFSMFSEINGLYPGEYYDDRKDHKKSVPFSGHNKSVPSSACIVKIVYPAIEDQILDCVQFFKEKNAEKLVLLSNDVSLKIKALAEGFICETAEIFRETLMNPFSKRFLWAESSPTGLTWNHKDDLALRDKYRTFPLKHPSILGENVTGLKILSCPTFHCRW